MPHPQEGSLSPFDVYFEWQHHLCISSYIDYVRVSQHHSRWTQSRLGPSCLGPPSRGRRPPYAGDYFLVARPTVDDINPALPIIRNIPQFPWFRVHKVVQVLYHQQYHPAEASQSCPFSGSGLLIGQFFFFPGADTPWLSLAVHPALPPKP